MGERVRVEERGAGGCRSVAKHLAIVLRLGTSHTRTIYGAQASAWRHNLNGRGRSCREGDTHTHTHTSPHHTKGCRAGGAHGTLSTPRYRGMLGWV